MDDPFVSIVVPAYNEAATIEEVLDDWAPSQGKKITWRDGIHALGALVRFRVGPGRAARGRSASSAG